MRTAGLLTRSGRANSATLSAIFVANFVEVRSDAIGRSIARSPIPCKLSPMQRLAKNIGGLLGNVLKADGPMVSIHHMSTTPSVP